MKTVYLSHLNLTSFVVLFQFFYMIFFTCFYEVFITIVSMNLCKNLNWVEKLQSHWLEPVLVIFK